MFTLSIFLMAIPTLAIGLMPTYADIGIYAPIILLLLPNTLIEGFLVLFPNPERSGKVKRQKIIQHIIPKKLNKIH